MNKKYYVIYVVNGALQVEQITGWTDLDKAKVKFHDVCKTLWNSKDVVSAMVKILDEQLDKVEDFMELITHPQDATEE